MNIKYLTVMIVLFPFVLGCTKKIDNYDARITGKEVLTPLPDKRPKINAPARYGVTSQKPFIYRIPAQGKRPIIFSAEGLPPSITLDKNTGILRGTTPLKKAVYSIKLTAKNNHGSDSQDWNLVVGDTLALTPPMGWNHWNVHYHLITDKIIRDAADAMVSSGMADVGYDIVGLDGCWQRITDEWAEISTDTSRKTASIGLDYEDVVLPVRDKDGNILPNNNFPDMQALTDHIHDKGLKAGIYATPGPRDCQDYEGSYQHEAQDAKTIAEWGFDLLKYDWCRYSEVYKQLHESEQTIEAQKKPFELMDSLLGKQNRDILYYICQYGMGDVWKWGDALGELWRIGGDLAHTFDKGGVYRIAKQNIELREFNGPGGWNDPDFLMLDTWRPPKDKGGPIRPVPFSPNEKYSYMSLWCMMSSPLFFCGDMSQLDEFDLNLLCNNEMVAINQDKLGRCAIPVRMDSSAWILKKSLSDGSLVIGVFDRKNDGDQYISMSLDELGISGEHQARDLWRQNDIGALMDSFSVMVGPLGCAIIKLKPVM